MHNTIHVHTHVGNLQALVDAHALDAPQRSEILEAKLVHRVVDLDERYATGVPGEPQQVGEPRSVHPGKHVALTHGRNLLAKRHTCWRRVASRRV